jgi:hypothetical protein
MGHTSFWSVLMILIKWKHKYPQKNVENIRANKKVDLEI